MNDMVDRVAKAIQNETDKFENPVRFYIEPEAQARWRKSNPDKDYWNDPHDELESYRIIARAIIEAMTEPAA